MLGKREILQFCFYIFDKGKFCLDLPHYYRFIPLTFSDLSSCTIGRKSTGTLRYARYMLSIAGGNMQ